MPYNPETDAIQVMGKPYKAALKQLAKLQRNTQQNVIEKLIAQACEATGFNIPDFENKKE